LKRKIADLAPVTAEVFAQKVLGICPGNQADVAQQDQLRLSASQANYTQTCVPCKKTFYSQNAFNNHLSAKRHRLATLRSRVDVRDDESVAGSETVSLGMTGSVASLDDVQAIEQGVEQMEIVDEEVYRF
jgi:pre-60S factor REI1